MIAELGHFALVLALALALAQSSIPFWGALAGDRRLMAVAAPVARDPVPARRARLRRARPGLCRLRLLAPQRRREFAFVEAAPLQGDRRLGEPRGLDAPLGADPRLVRRPRRRLRPQPAGEAEGAGPVGPGLDRHRLPALHPRHLQPVRPPRPAAGRGQRPQPGAPGHRPRHPSAASLSRLCRLLDLLRLRRRRPDRRARSTPPGRAGCGRGRSPPGCSSPSASPWAPTGPITSSAGAASGSGTRSRTPR